MKLWMTAAILKWEPDVKNSFALQKLRYDKSGISLPPVFRVGSLKYPAATLVPPVGIVQTAPHPSQGRPAWSALTSGVCR